MTCASPAALAAVPLVLLALTLTPSAEAQPPAQLEPRGAPSPLTSTSAVEGPRRGMTLEQALSFARTHQPAVRAAMARINAARAEAKIPRAEWLPSVTAAAEVIGGSANNTTTLYLGVPGLEMPRIGATKTPADNATLFKPYASTFAGASVSQELFDFGRIAAQSAALDAYIEVAEEQGKDVSLQIDLNVEEAFFAVHAAHAVARASEAAYQRARTHRDEAQAGVQAGLRAPIDLTRAEADLTRFDVGRIRAQGGLLVAETGFAAAVGAPDLLLDAQGDAPPPSALPSLQGALERASERNPLLLESMARLRAQEATTRSIEALLRPNLAATAGFSGREGGAPSTSGYVNRFDGWLPKTPNWDVGLVFTWPLFDAVIVARGDAARQVEEIRKQEIGVVRQEQTAAVTQGYVAVQAAGNAIVALQRALQAAVANYAQAEARFKGGLGTSVELADAEAVRTEAEIQLAIGQFNLSRARAEFARLIAEGM